MHILSIIEVMSQAGAWKEWSDDVKTNVFRHQIKIRIMMDELQPMFCAECANKYIDRLSNRDTF